MVAGTEIKITPEGVFITTPGIFRVKANEHVFEGGDRVDYKPYEFHTKNFLELNYHWPTLEPVYKAPYLVVFDNGQEFKGFLDENGYAKIENVPVNQDYEVWYGEDQRNTHVDIPNDSIIGKMTDEELLEIQKAFDNWDGEL